MRGFLVKAAVYFGAGSFLLFYSMLKGLPLSSSMIPSIITNFALLALKVAVGVGIAFLAMTLVSLTVVAGLLCLGSLLKQRNRHDARNARHTIHPFNLARPSFNSGARSFNPNPRSFNRRPFITTILNHDDNPLFPSTTTERPFTSSAQNNAYHGFRRTKQAKLKEIKAKKIDPIDAFMKDKTYQQILDKIKTETNYDDPIFDSFFDRVVSFEIMQNPIKAYTRDVYSDRKTHESEHHYDQATFTKLNGICPVNRLPFIRSEADTQLAQKIRTFVREEVRKHLEVVHQTKRDQKQTMHI